MGFGLRVWNAAGKLQVDSEAGISRLVATYTVKMKGSSASGSGVSSFTQSVSGMAFNGHWAVVMSGQSIWEGAPQDVIKVTINAGSFTAQCMTIYASDNDVTFAVLQI